MPSLSQHTPATSGARHLKDAQNPSFYPGATTPAAAEAVLPGPVVGFAALSGACFLNAGVQLLLACSPLLQQLRQHRQQQQQQHAAQQMPLGMPQWGPLGFALQQAALHAGGDGPHVHEGPYNLHALLAALRRTAPHLKERSRQDCHEVLRLLLEGLSAEERCGRQMAVRQRKHHQAQQQQQQEQQQQQQQQQACAPLAGGQASTDASGAAAASPSAAAAVVALGGVQLEQLVQAPTLIERTFGGRLAAVVTCSCGFESASSEPFLDLSLPLPREWNSRHERKAGVEPAARAPAAATISAAATAPAVSVAPDLLPPAPSPSPSPSPSFSSSPLPLTPVASPCFANNNLTWPSSHQNDRPSSPMQLGDGPCAAAAAPGGGCTAAANGHEGASVGPTPAAGPLASSVPCPSGSLKRKPEHQGHQEAASSAAANGAIPCHDSFSLTGIADALVEACPGGPGAAGCAVGPSVSLNASCAPASSANLGEACGTDGTTPCAAAAPWGFAIASGGAAARRHTASGTLPEAATSMQWHGACDREQALPLTTQCTPCWDTAEAAGASAGAGAGEGRDGQASGAAGAHGPHRSKARRLCGPSSLTAGFAGMLDLPGSEHGGRVCSTAVAASATVPDLEPPPTSSTCSSASHPRHQPQAPQHPHVSACLAELLQQAPLPCWLCPHCQSPSHQSESGVSPPSTSRSADCSRELWGPETSPSAAARGSAGMLMSRSLPTRKQVSWSESHHVHLLPARESGPGRPASPAPPPAAAAAAAAALAACVDEDSSMLLDKVAAADAAAVAEKAAAAASAVAATGLVGPTWRGFVPAPSSGTFVPAPSSGTSGAAPSSGTSGAAYLLERPVCTRPHQSGGIAAGAEAGPGPGSRPSLGFDHSSGSVFAAVHGSGKLERQQQQQQQNYHHHHHHHRHHQQELRQQQQQQLQQPQHQEQREPRVSGELFSMDDMPPPPPSPQQQQQQHHGHHHPPHAARHLHAPHHSVTHHLHAHSDPRPTPLPPPLWSPTAVVSPRPPVECGAMGRSSSVPIKAALKRGTSLPSGGPPPAASTAGDLPPASGPAHRAHRMYRLSALPPVLLLHLQRFKRDERGKMRKAALHVGFDFELELSTGAPAAAGVSGTVVSGPTFGPLPGPGIWHADGRPGLSAHSQQQQQQQQQQQPHQQQEVQSGTSGAGVRRYQLVGVVEHQGGAKTGRYVAYVCRRRASGDDVAAAAASSSAHGLRLQHQSSHYHHHHLAHHCSHTHLHSHPLQHQHQHPATHGLHAHAQHDAPFSLQPPGPGEGQGATTGASHAHQQWFCVSDATVKPVTHEEVASAQAYILMYVEIGGVGAPGGGDGAAATGASTA